MKLKQCAVCGKYKPYTNFGKNKNTKDKKHSICKECRHNYYIANKEYVKEYNNKNRHRKWCRTTLNDHKKSGYIINMSIDELHEMSKITEICPLCGRVINWHSKTSAQDSPSLDRTDNNNELTVKNTMIICKSCNSSKGSMSLNDYINYLSDKYDHPNMKLCSKCNIWKPLNAFGTDSSRTDNCKRYCQTCLGVK